MGSAVVNCGCSLVVSLVVSLVQPVGYWVLMVSATINSQWFITMVHEVQLVAKKWLVIVV